MDYATRYPEAIPSQNVDSRYEDGAAEALLDMCSQVGVLEEVLSDLGTPLMSDCMREVSRLLSIQRLTIFDYHPACNGLVGKFYGTNESVSYWL